MNIVLRPSPEHSLACLRKINSFKTLDSELLLWSMPVPCTSAFFLLNSKGPHETCIQWGSAQQDFVPEPVSNTLFSLTSLFFYLILIVSFPLPFSPLLRLLPSNHHTVVHVYEFPLFFLFAQSLHPLNSPSKLSSCSLSMSLSLFCLLVQFVH